jgi:hypothetical protein
VAALTLALLSVTTLIAVRSQISPAPATQPAAVPSAIQVKAESPAPRVVEAVPAKAPEAKPDLRPPDVRPAAKGATSASAYVTQADLTGFEPVKELRIRILPRENDNER